MTGNSLNKGKKIAAPRSPEFRAKLRAAFTEERRAALILRNKTTVAEKLKGRSCPEVVEANKRRTGEKRSAETRAKISAAAKARHSKDTHPE